MNHQLIRSLDAWAGLVVCFALSLHRKMFSASRLSPLKSILFIKLIEQGASVLAAPAFQKAVELVGRDHVYICVFEENRAIIDVLGLIPPANVLTVRSDKLWSFLKDLFKVIWQVRQLKIAATVDMEFFSRASAIIAYLMGAKVRAGLHRFTMTAPYRGNLLTHKILYNPHLHVSKVYLALVEVLELAQSAEPANKLKADTDALQPPHFSPSQQDLKSTLKLMSDHSISMHAGTKRIILNPNASDLMPLRKWDSKRYLELARLILVTYPDANIILTGVDRESDAASAFCQSLKSPRLISLEGKTSLRQLLTLFTLCDVLVTSDSGPAHFASMTNIHSVVLFGPETPALYGPLGTRAKTLSANLGCSPCINALNHRLSPCTNSVCMQMISVAEVFRVMQQAFNQNKERLPRSA